MINVVRHGAANSIAVTLKRQLRTAGSTVERMLASARMTVIAADEQSTAAQTINGMAATMGSSRRGR